MRISILLVLLFFIGGNIFAQQLNADSLELRDGIGYAFGSTVPYTGTVVVINEIGTNESSVEYKDGEPNGKLRSWYLNGNKQIEGELHGTTQAGIWKAWYESGQLKRQGAFKDGKEEGVFTWYFDDGRKSKEGSYHEGVAIGEWSWYHDNGQLMQQGELKGDTSIGIWKEWYPDGKPRMVGDFLNGQKHGEWTWWDAKGNKSTKSYATGSITQASDSIDLYIERTNEEMGKRDFNASLVSVQQAIDLVTDRSEGNPEYMWLVILKAGIYEHFQHLEAAQSTLLDATGIPVEDLRVIVGAHDSSAFGALRSLAEKMAGYPTMATRLGPYVALALVHNMLGDSVAMQAEQQLMMDRADTVNEDWVLRMSLNLYRLQANKEVAYAKLASVRSEITTEGETRANQLALAAYLTDLGRFTEAAPIADKYLTLDPEDLDFLIVKVNIAMGNGDVAEMEKCRAEALRIDPRALDE